MLDKNQEQLSKKYKNLSKTSQESHAEPRNKTLSPEQLNNKKLRQAHFELKKLKEEIAKKNIEVLAITKDLQKWDQNRTKPETAVIDNMKRKSSLSPYLSEKLSSKKDEEKVGYKTLKKGNAFLKPKLRIQPIAEYGLNNQKLSVLKEESDLEESKESR